MPKKEPATRSMASHQSRICWRLLRPVPFGLEIVTALDHARNRFPQPVQVRIGIRTGLVVVGQKGTGGLGDFPLAYFSVTHTHE